MPHTKGPWAVSLRSGSINGAAIIAPGGLVVARLPHEADRVYFDKESDARLLAVSPDLLESGAAVLASIESGACNDFAALHRLSIAVKKALGEDGDEDGPAVASGGSGGAGSGPMPTVYVGGGGGFGGGIGGGIARGFGLAPEPDARPKRTTTVYKYQLPSFSDVVDISMPSGAAVLYVDVQHGVPCLWARVDPDALAVRRRFRIAGTGHPLGKNVSKHVGTFQLQGGSLIFHVFEVVGPEVDSQ